MVQLRCLVLSMASILLAFQISSVLPRYPPLLCRSPRPLSTSHCHRRPTRVIKPMSGITKPHSQRISPRLATFFSLVPFIVSDDFSETESLHRKFRITKKKIESQVPVHSTTAPLQKIRKEIAILEEAVAEDDRLAAIGRIKKLQVSGKVARVSAAMWRGAACASGNLFFV